jgi:hypothetical protein
MAPRGSQPSNFKTKQRQKRISDLKARIAALEKQTPGKGGFRNKNRISQLKRKLRDMNAGYQKITPTNTKKKLVKTSRGLKIRNVANKPKKKYNDGKMSNIPAGEATVNNPNFGKPGNFKDEPKEVKKDKVVTNEKKDKAPSFTESVEASKDGGLVKDSKPKSEGKKKKQSKYIKTKKGNLARRGSVGARRAENREKARKKAQAAAKKRIEEKLKIKKKVNG